MLLSAANLRKSFGPQTLFDGLNLRLDRGERVGLIGENGSGKTTLFNILTGQMEPDSGQVQIARGTSVGHLRQDAEFPPGTTVIDEAESAFAGLHDQAHRLRELEHAMAEAAADREAVMAEYDRVRHDYEAAGGYAWHHRLEATLMGVGLPREIWETSVELLSGGQKSRLALAKLLVSEPDVLLLDEPTNHLDLSAIEWLENYLLRFQGGGGSVLLISHDRFLLDRLATRIVWLTQRRLFSYPGNYSAFVVQRETAELSQARAYEKQQADIAKQAEFVRRFKAGQRAKEAKGREKRLNRLLASDEMVAAVAKSKNLSLSFVTEAAGSENVLRVEGISKRHGELELWRDVSFALQRGERMGIVGPNGSGKTTLLRCLVGEADADAGKVRWGHGLSIGYYDQRLDDFDLENTVIEEVWEGHPEVKEPQMRTILGSMRFSGETIYKPISALSGGERARVALTKLLLDKPNVLVLDEPTNHLDIASRDALEAALRDYPGTIIAVSHDRYFLTNVTGRMLILEPPRVRVFLGTWPQWVQKRAAMAEGADRTAASAGWPPSARAAEATDAGQKLRSPTRNGRSVTAAVAQSKNKYARPFGTLETKALEAKITETEIELAQMQAAFADGQLMSQPAEARRVQAEFHRLSKKLEQLEQEYFSRAD